MMHGRIGPMRPECVPTPVNVYSKKSSGSEIGRATKKGEMELKCSLRCILSVAKPEERERFNQMGVTVTHSLIQRGSPIAKESDVFALNKNGKETRWFRVQAVHNKGEMDIDTVYYCEERGDLK